MKKVVGIFIKIFVLMFLAVAQSYGALSEESQEKSQEKSQERSHLTQHQILQHHSSQNHFPVSHQMPFSEEPCSELEIEEEPEKINHEENDNGPIGAIECIGHIQLSINRFQFKVSYAPKGIWKPPQNFSI